jgi:hypothetical protein
MNKLAKHKTVVFTFLILSVSILTILSIRGQVQRQAPKTSQLPVVDFESSQISNNPTTSQQVQRERKSLKYQRRYLEPIKESQDISLEYKSTHWSRGLSAIPVDKSDVIVVGIVNSADAVLSADKLSIFSEFVVQIQEVLKRDKSFSDIDQSITVDRYGGAVRFKSGKVQQYSYHDYGYPRVGGRYIFFLQRTGDYSDLSILTGYELLDQHVFPLDGTVGEYNVKLPFEQYRDKDEKAFLDEVREAIAKTSQKGGQN